MTATTFDPHTLIAEGRLGVLATIKSNGLPQLSPVTPFYDRDAGVIYVSMTEGRSKTTNRRRDPHRARSRSTRARGRSACRLLPQRRGRAPGLGRVPRGDGVRSQGVDGDDGRPRIRREDPLTVRDCLAA